MDKREEIPQWATDKAREVQKGLNAEVSAEMILSLYDAEEQDILHIAEALSQARSQAIRKGGKE